METINLPSVATEGVQDFIENMVLFVQRYLKSEQEWRSIVNSFDQKNYSQSFSFIFNSDTPAVTGFIVHTIPQNVLQDPRLGNFFGELYMGKLSRPIQINDKTYDFICRGWFKNGYFVPQRRQEHLCYLSKLFGNDLKPKRHQTGKQPDVRRRRNVFMFEVKDSDLYIDFKNQQDHQLDTNQQIVLGTKYNQLYKKFQDQIKIVAKRVIEVPQTFTQLQSVKLMLSSEHDRQFVSYSCYTSQILKDFYYDVYQVAIQSIPQLTNDLDISQEVVDKFLDDVQSSQTRDNILKFFYTPLPSGEYYDMITAMQYKGFFNNGSNHIHSSVYSKLKQTGQLGIFNSTNCSDILCYDTSYITQLILVSYWIRQVLLPDRVNVSNNNSVLVMFGDSGSGKSHIVHILNQLLVNYKWVIGADFVSSSVFDAQMISLEDIKLEHLFSKNIEQNKSLLDFENSCKVNIKFAPSIDVSLHCPVVITTNDSMEQIYQSRLNQEHITAFKRRVFPIKFSGKYVDKHQQELTEQDIYKQFDSIQKLETLLSIIAMSFLMDDTPLDRKVNNIQIDNELISFYHQVIYSFSKTCWGQIFIKNRKQLLKVIDLYTSIINLPEFSNSKLETAQQKMTSGIERFIQEYASTNNIDLSELMMNNSFTVNNFIVHKQVENNSQFRDWMQFVFQQIPYGSHGLLSFIQDNIPSQYLIESQSQNSFVSEDVIRNSARKPESLQKQLLGKRQRDVDSLFGDDLDRFIRQQEIDEVIQTSAQKRFKRVQSIEQERVRVIHSLGDMLQGIVEEEKVEPQKLNFNHETIIRSRVYNESPDFSLEYDSDIEKILGFGPITRHEYSDLVDVLERCQSPGGTDRDSQ